MILLYIQFRQQLLLETAFGSSLRSGVFLLPHTVEVFIFFPRKSYVYSPGQSTYIKDSAYIYLIPTYSFSASGVSEGGNVRYLLTLLTLTWAYFSLLNIQTVILVEYPYIF